MVRKDDAREREDSVSVIFSALCSYLTPASFSNRQPKIVLQWAPIRTMGTTCVLHNTYLPPTSKVLRCVTRSDILWELTPTCIVRFLIGTVPSVGVPQHHQPISTFGTRIDESKTDMMPSSCLWFFFSSSLLCPLSPQNPLKGSPT